MKEFPDGLYAVLHKGLRARLCGVLEDCGRTDWRDPVQSERTLAGLEALLIQLDAHETGEDRILHAAMEVCEEGASAATARDHQVLAQARGALRQEARRLREQPTGQRVAAGRRLERRLMLYLADCLEHMLCEELENRPFLRSRLGPEQLAWLERESLRLLSHDLREQLMAWAWHAATAQERVGLRALSPGRPCVGAECETGLVA